MKIETSKVVGVTTDIDVNIERKNNHLYLAAAGDVIDIGTRGLAKMLIVLHGMSESECICERGGDELYIRHRIEPECGYEVRFAGSSAPLFWLDNVDAFAFKLGLERVLAAAVFHVE